jgi:hypothetical protein
MIDSTQKRETKENAKVHFIYRSFCRQVSAETHLAREAEK